jgi:hypothetical protein
MENQNLKRKNSGAENRKVKQTYDRNKVAEGCMSLLNFFTKPKTSENVPIYSHDPVNQLDIMPTIDDRTIEDFATSGKPDIGLCVDFEFANSMPQSSTPVVGLHCESTFTTNINSAVNVSCHSGKKIDI